MRRTTHPSRLTAAALLLLLQPAWSQTWLQLVPTGTPPSPRYVRSQAYDAVNDRLILFSGTDSTWDGPPDDIWVLRDATGAAGAPSWIQLTPSTAGPPGRETPTILYAPASNRLIVHGGILCGYGGCGPHLGDTWVLTNANGLGGTPEWIQLPSALVRNAHAAVYDPKTNRMIVFGGRLPFDNDVWVLTGADGNGDSEWQQLSPLGTPPEGRSYAGAAYDPATNRLIILGGLLYPACCTLAADDVWILTNANGLGGTPEWMRLDLSGPTPPPARWGQAVAYDPSTNQLVMFGGVGPDWAYFDDVWVLAAANGLGGIPEWTKLEPGGTPPPARAHHSAGYAPDSERLVIAVGRNLEPGLLNDVWVLQDVLGITVVDIDIKPWDYPNTINLGSKGSVPVAIFGSASFDASTVDPITVTLAGATVRMKGKGTPMASTEDVNSDGWTDMVVHVSTEALQLTSADSEVTLKGMTTDGNKFEGKDTVRIVP